MKVYILKSLVEHLDCYDLYMNKLKVFYTKKGIYNHMSSEYNELINSYADSIDEDKGYYLSEEGASIYIPDERRFVWEIETIDIIDALI